jgi:hypothetical protein
MCIGAMAAALVATGCGGGAAGGAEGDSRGVERLPSPPSSVTLSRAARILGVPLRMDIALLRRAGRVVTLDLRLRSLAAHGERYYEIGSDFAKDCCADDSLSGVYLMDPTTGAKLNPLVRDHQCVCTQQADWITIAPGGTAMLTASFPAPSPAAHTADVIVPHFGAFRDVPLRG